MSEFEVDEVSKVSSYLTTGKLRSLNWSSETNANWAQLQAKYPSWQSLHNVRLTVVETLSSGQSYVKDSEGLEFLAGHTLLVKLSPLEQLAMEAE